MLYSGHGNMCHIFVVLVVGLGLGLGWGGGWWVVGVGGWGVGVGGWGVGVGGWGVGVGGWGVGVGGGELGGGGISLKLVRKWQSDNFVFPKSSKGTRNKLKRNSNQSAMVFIRKCSKNRLQKSPILSRPQWVQWSTAEGYNKSTVFDTDLVKSTGILQA